MSTANTAATAEQLYTLTINRSFDAPREVVFDAWTDADALAKWFAPDPKMLTVVDELDVKPGGRYQLQMQEQDGDTYIVTGEYVNIDRPNQLVFTWQWIHGDDRDIMLLTLDFKEQNGKTEMCMTHEKLPSAESRDHHDEGWQGCFNRLEQFVTG